MQLLGGQERKFFPEIEARLGAENRKRSGARSVLPRRALFQDEPKKIVVLLHRPSINGKKPPDSIPISPRRD
jgi:hypothetical protein